MTDVEQRIKDIKVALLGIEVSNLLSEDEKRAARQITLRYLNDVLSVLNDLARNV